MYKMLLNDELVLKKENNAKEGIRMSINNYSILILLVNLSFLVDFRFLLSKYSDEINKCVNTISTINSFTLFHFVMEGLLLLALIIRILSMIKKSILFGNICFFL